VPVIFANPAGAPELACDECGCRWFDRLTDGGADRCYECGTPVPEAERAAFRAALEAFARGRHAPGNPPSDAEDPRRER